MPSIKTVLDDGGVSVMLGLLGAGLLYVVPNKPWLGWSFIILALLIGAWRFGRYQERKWMEAPNLDLTIDEAFIVPVGENTGHCFLRISLHNLSLSNTSIPPPTAYGLALTIDGKKYDDTVPLNLDDYELQHYLTTTDEEDFPGQDVHILSYVEPLDDIRAKSGDLKRDFRIYGWIGISVRYLPSWGTDKELITTRHEYRVMIDGEEPIDEYEDEYRYIRHVRNVEALVLTVKDAHRIEWHAKTIGPFTKRDKGIVRKKRR